MTPELNDFIIQLDEEVEGMQSTILVLQQQLKETRQQLSQAGPSRTSPSDPAGAPEAAGKDGGRLANGPSNGNPAQRTYREASSADEDSALSPGGGGAGVGGEVKLSNHAEERVGRGGGVGVGGGAAASGGAYTNQLSAGYESVDSPTGSETSLTQHSNDTDSNHESQEDKAASGCSSSGSSKGSRTAGSRHAQNGLDSSSAAHAAIL